jgi:hypothetical protein
MVLFEEEMAISLLVVGLLEVGVFLQSSLITLFSSLEFHQLDVDLADIAVVFGHFGISLDSFFVLLQCLRELS